MLLSAGGEGSGRADYSFGKALRLTRAGEFRAVRERGRRQHGRYLVLTALAVDGETGARFGFVTSRRVGNAVARNRVRRQLREIVRHERWRVGAGLWVVTVARREAVAVAGPVLRQEWLRLAGRASILREGAGRVGDGGAGIGFI